MKLAMAQAYEHDEVVFIDAFKEVVFTDLYEEVVFIDVSKIDSGIGWMTIESTFEVG